MSESQSELPPANMETLVSSIASAKPNTAIKGSPGGPIGDDYAAPQEQGTTE